MIQFKLTAPTGQYAVVFPLEAPGGVYSWLLHQPDLAIIRKGEIARSERAAKAQARRDLEVAAYWPARIPPEMRRTRWQIVDAAGDEATTPATDEWLCRRYIDLLTLQIADLSRVEIERNYAPVRLADRRFGVRVVGLRDGRLQLLEYKVLDAPEFEGLVAAMDTDATDQVNGAMVV